MTVQIIEMDGRKMALLPEEEYRSLAELAEDAGDSLAAERAEARRLAGEEYVPHCVVERLVAGEHPLAVWRTYRGMTPQDLAARAGLAIERLTAIEAQDGRASAREWRRLADALDLELDDIMPLD